MIYTNIGTAIYNLVDAIVDLWADEIYNYEPKQPDGYPYVSVTPQSSIETLFWSISNTAEIPYSIKVTVQYDDLGVQENKIRVMVDKILEALRADVYLGDLAQKSQYEVEWWYSNDEQVNRIATIKATYTVLIC